jgi:hypothetical protein
MREGRLPVGQPNGPASQWVEKLAMMVLEHGISTFILASDNPATLQQFAEEVAPALRERVALGRKA